MRRSRRRNITEELQLLKMLDECPEPAARIRNRVKVVLEQYEPHEARVATRRKRLTTVVEGLTAMLASVLAVVVFELTTPWAIGVVGLTLGVAVNVVEWLVERRRDRVEQDAAVHEVTANLTGSGKSTAEVSRMAPGGGGPDGGE